MLEGFLFLFTMSKFSALVRAFTENQQNSKTCRIDSCLFAMQVYLIFVFWYLHTTEFKNYLNYFKEWVRFLNIAFIQL